MNILDKNELPKWQCVKYDIELKIITGEYKGGERVPSVHSLSNLYIGTSTPQSILEKMAQEKTLIMEQGIGYKVNSRAVKRLKDEHLKRITGIFEQACEYAYTLQIDPMMIVREICEKRNIKENQKLTMYVQNGIINNVKRT